MNTNYMENLCRHRSPPSHPPSPKLPICQAPNKWFISSTHCRLFNVEHVNDKDKNKIVANPMPLNQLAINNGTKTQAHTAHTHAYTYALFLNGQQKRTVCVAGACDRKRIAYCIQRIISIFIHRMTLTSARSTKLKQFNGTLSIFYATLNVKHKKKIEMK